MKYFIPNPDAKPEVWSLPSWERGLKFVAVAISMTSISVAPLVGAWIEIPTTPAITPQANVAPLVGAWIEIR